jgi:two-component system cell cycle response regulator
MTGRILVVDDVATNRIIMKVKLAAACYQVLQADCGLAALKIAKAEQPDLIILDVLMPDMDGMAVCDQLKADPETADIPVILVTALADNSSKMRGLQRGADDFLTKPVDEIALLARVRSLLRAREIQRELRLREETCAELGFHEPAAGFEDASHIALIAPDPATALAWKRALEAQVKAKISILPRQAALADITAKNAPDVFVIASDLTHHNEGLRLLSDFRSRPASRHAATIMIVPTADSERAAIALDLGAGDILYDPFDAAELAVRIKTQLRRKRQSDRLRASVQIGLELAVTDSLTGLHNRRYAMHHLNRMLAAHPSGVAVMMLDLDFFKSVNDRFGHAAGDRVLAVVAKRLRENVRGVDLLARLGGEEFLVAIPTCDAKQACDQAERLREVVCGTPIKILESDTPILVTISVGVALKIEATETAEVLLLRADKALSGSKSEGRNVVRVAA